MDIDSCYQVGYVIKRHGFKGDVKILLESSLPKNLESIFVEIDNRLIPFFIEEISGLNDIAIVKLEDVNNSEQADRLSKCRLYLPNSSKSKSDKLETNNLIGFTVCTDSEELGTITAINNHALNPLLVVSLQGKEFLIPISDYFIKEIDASEKRVKVALPEGFLDI
ncbi:MAG: 16S rRNA processing protein RimM [Cyclobacteriaceae bacterium]|nr:16S rRNA processing protein RimM [Cyclobacteriaceae bacterium]